MTERHQGVTGWQGSLLRQLREERSMTRRQLAGRIGVAVDTVGSWERSASSPRVRHLLALAQQLGVELTVLAPLPKAPTLRELRERVGLTQGALAARLGRNAGGVARVEHGDYWPRDSRRWCEALAVDEIDLRRAWEASRREAYS